MDKLFKVAVVLSAYDKMSTVVNSAVSGTTHKLEKLEKFSKTFNKATDEAVLAGEGITQFFEKSIDGAEQSERVANISRRVWKNMGDVTGEAAEQAEKYAKAYAPTIGKTHEEVMEVQNKLAIFKSLSSETGRASGLFDRATRAAFNFAANGMGEATTNAVKFGKALENPDKYVKSLAKGGVIFTDQELKKIKALQKSGHLHAAQQILIEAIEKKSKGLAETSALASDKMKAKWHEQIVAIGEKLLPTFDQLVEKVMTLMDMVGKFAEKNQGLVKGIAIAGAALLAFGAIGKVLAFTVGGLSSLIKILGYSIEFIGTVWEAISVFFAANPIIAIILVVAGAAYLIYKNWDSIKKWWFILWDNMKAIISKAFHLFIAIINPFTPAILIYRHWSGITQFFSKIWAGIKEIFLSHVKWVMDLGKLFYDAGKNIVMSIWEGIKSFISKPVEAIKGMAEKIRKYLPFSPAKEGALKDIHKIRLVETIAESIKVQPVVAAMRRVGNAVFNTGPSNTHALAVAGGGGHNFTINISLNGGASQSDAKMISESLRQTILQVIKGEDNRKKRVGF